MIKNNLKTSLVVIFYSIFASLFLYIVENIFHPKYLFIIIQKILFFIVLPLVIGFIFKTKIWIFWKINKKSLIYWSIFWVIWSILVFLAYYFLRDYISWDDIKNSLAVRWINSLTFIFAFIYVMFWNSLIEEFFFRWFIFHFLVEKYKYFAYFFSAILFALYHMAIFWDWFNIYLMIVAIFGLFLGWIFFSWLYKKTSWIWWAWIFHILVDLVIVIIWYFELFR